MKEDRLKRKIERLTQENKELKQEKENVKDLVFRYEEKEKLLDATIQEYRMMIDALRKSQEQYKTLIRKLRQFDGKMMDKYEKSVNKLIQDQQS